MTYFFLYQSSKTSKESLSFVVFLDYIILWWRHEIYDVMSFGQIKPSPPQKNNVPVRLCPRGPKGPPLNLQSVYISTNHHN